MIFSSNDFLEANTREEEEEVENEDAETGVDDALLGELDDQEIVDEIDDPLLAEIKPEVDDTEEEEAGEDDLTVPLPDEDDEEEMDYDSFDDHDEM